jgi:hypothetical protein
MKKYFNRLILLSVSGMVLLASCKKDQDKVYYTGGSAPVLTSTATDSIPLPVSDTTANAVTFNWTNPNYQFSDGVSSLNVTYALQFDTLTSFSSGFPPVTIESSLSQTFTVSQLNNIVANQMGLPTGVSSTIHVRLESFISPFTSNTAEVAPLYSSALSYTVIPYAPPPAILPPPSGELFVTGDATPQGWLSGTTTQQFTPVPGSNGLQFTITIQLNGSGQYKFIGNNNSYNYQYTISTNDDPNEVNGGPFISGSSNNIMAPPATGSYIILVNFQTGKFTVTAQ